MQGVSREKDNLLEGVAFTEGTRDTALDKDREGFVDGTFDWLEDGILDGAPDEAAEKDLADAATKKSQRMKHVKIKSYQEIDSAEAP